ncbi:hypothetical protein Desdi_1285 [Desulfitobacterium dichloroeliminans LMG P-21439]|jgi:hypothetical protein|uniref:Uncharacterized protein n=1 Tax=Desulfitobacterium dichloroeliminans (strain LMG P-21439 / DCA1) TaxID=871963 RepID=L0F6H9_DESDL|nr:DUF6133 family protein [Desulfitobacterium dichloroeliminans]AGA68797.1 hypothetical protein Desdi_1285 [Desulfitobacterium dichloroeliminans LMG P-21439]
MKKLTKKIIGKANDMITRVIAKNTEMFLKSRVILCSQRGEGFVDTAIKILMAVVIGALLLGGLYALFGETILPTLKQRIIDMFNYGG